MQHQGKPKNLSLIKQAIIDEMATTGDPDAVAYQLDFLETEMLTEKVQLQELAIHQTLGKEIYVLEDQVKYLKSMIEWMVEAHGDSVTTDYTADSNPWKLKDYVEECMLEFKKMEKNTNI